MIAIIDKSKNVANVYDTITTVYGRRLVIVAGKPKKYYFEPFINPSDLNMIKGVILADKYLSNKEKPFLHLFTLFIMVTILMQKNMLQPFLL